METKLKYRMVGILVLTALAVIFIPMIFSGSEQDRDAYMAEMPEGPGFGQGHRISVIDLQAEMRARERESATAMPVYQVDETDYVEQPAEILDQNGLPIGWSLQVGSFLDQETAVRLRASIRQLGHGSYVLRKLTNDGLFFQVLVGPSLDRNALLKIGQQLSSEMDLSVQIVRYRVEDDSSQVGG